MYVVDKVSQSGVLAAAKFKAEKTSRLCPSFGDNAANGHDWPQTLDRLCVEERYLD